jgi:uncharacterized membrane protein
MMEGLKEKLVTWGWPLFIVVVSFILFVNVIQPALVGIHPMFTTQPQISGRRPNTPAGLAFFATFAILYIVTSPLYIVLCAWAADDW